MHQDNLFEPIGAVGGFDFPAGKVFDAMVLTYAIDDVRARRESGRAVDEPHRRCRGSELESVEGGERNELNLIGMRTTDALRKLEEFLDNAFLTNRAEVRIVHGIGSGALRKAVAEYLGTSPYCASFRGAEPHHGGAGATIVQMNL